MGCPGAVTPGGEHTASLKQTAGPVTTSSDLTFLPSLLQLGDGTGQPRKAGGRSLVCVSLFLDRRYLLFTSPLEIILVFSLVLQRALQLLVSLFTGLYAYHMSVKPFVPQVFAKLLLEARSV